MEQTLFTYLLLPVHRRILRGVLEQEAVICMVEIEYIDTLMI